MKIYFIGNGKTGKDLLAKIPEKYLAGHCLDDCQKISWQELEKVECVWFFGTAEMLASTYQDLIKTGKYVIINLAQEKLPKDLNQVLKKQNLSWVFAPRICLGMNLMSPFIDFINKSSLFWNDLEVNIHDVAANDESKDPTSLAKEWQSKITTESNILIDRISGNPGSTCIDLITANESISIKHKVSDRNAYIQGALWASYKLVFTKSANSGLLRFEELFWNNLQENLFSAPTYSEANG